MLLIGFFARLAQPVVAGTLATYGYIIGIDVSQDMADASMYESSCNVAKAQGTPAPDPSDFQRQGT